MTYFLRAMAGALIALLVSLQVALPGRMTLLGAGKAPSIGPVVISNTDSATDSSAQTTYTYTSRATGTAASDRVTVIVSFGRCTVLGLSGVTIGGASATNIVTLATASTILSIDALLNASGTTSTVVVTYTGACIRAGIGVYSLRGTGGLTTTTQTNSASSVSGNVAATTLNINASGGAIALAGIDSGGAQTSTWTGLTDGTAAGDFNLTPGANNTFSGNRGAFGTAQTGLSIGDTFTGAAGGVGTVAASWPPG